MDTKTHIDPETQSVRDFLDNGSIKDERVEYADGSKREPTWSPDAEPERRPLAPSPFSK